LEGTKQIISQKLWVLISTNNIMSGIDRGKGGSSLEIIIRGFFG